MIPRCLIVVEGDEGFGLFARERPVGQIGGTDDHPSASIAFQKVYFGVRNGVFDDPEGRFALGNFGDNAPLLLVFETLYRCHQAFGEHLLAG